MSSFQETPAAQPSKLQQVIAKIAAGEKLDKIDLSNEGLVYFPEELFELSDTLEFLNMGGNKLSALPERIVEFKKLRIMFFAQNCFEEIPVQLGKMDSLFMLSFKSNRLKRVDPESLSPSVCWLILTDNQIEVLPSTIGRLLHLRKLMLAGNRLTALPEELSSCKELELLRIAANQLPALPMWLLQMPCLSWLAYSGNPIAASAAEPLLPPVDIPWSQLQLGEVLGQGASGVVRRASWAEKPPCDESRYEGGDAVAVKLFRAGMTSDGLPEDEMKVFSQRYLPAAVSFISYRIHRS